MTTWILIWIVSGFEGFAGNTGVTTGTAIFHSQAACEKAITKFPRYTKAFCIEDVLSKPDGK